MATLVVTQDCVSVRSEGERLELIQRSDDPEQSTVRLQVPLFDVDRVMVVGRPLMTMAVFHKLLTYGIPVNFVSGRGKWLGALISQDKLNAARRIMQYESFRNVPWRERVASRIIYAKIRNSRRTLQRLAVVRKCINAPEQQKAMRTLRRIAGIVHIGGPLETLRGWEGMAAACYFSRLNDFFPPELPFVERSRQPPGNAANALLSWSYAIVQGEIDSA
ncbi:MAG: CRISPR-associated endonuclease Cas1, partial [Victivallaceae bacterium]